MRADLLTVPAGLARGRGDRSPGHRRFGAAAWLGSGLILLALGNLTPADPPMGLQTRLKVSTRDQRSSIDLLTELHRTAGVQVVAAGERLRRPIRLRKTELSAQEALDALAEHLEGKWQRRGELLVLGPPEGFEEIARTSPIKFPDYFARRWIQLLRSLRPADWGVLRERKPVAVDSLREPLRPSVMEIARLVYWIHRDDQEDFRPTLEMLQKRQVALELADCLGHPGKEILSVTVKDAVIQQRKVRVFHHYNHAPWVYEYLPQVGLGRDR